MIKYNRQEAPTLAGIRDDHLARYRFAADELNRRGIRYAQDIGCGCGYGSYILAESGLVVKAYDQDAHAIRYGKKHYPHDRVGRAVRELSHVSVPTDCGLVMFEIIEHSPAAPVFLTRAAPWASALVCSVPNEQVVPFKGPKVHPEHYRHYTAAQLEQELDAAGWRTVFKGSQRGKHKAEAEIIENNLTGRTLVFVAEPK